MKKLTAIILLLTTINLYSQDNTPVPYEEDEFSSILHDVRRSSIIFCGAFPLGYMYSSIVIPMVSDPNQYSDLSDVAKNNKEIETKLISSLIFSGVVMLIDLVIEKFFRR